MRRSLYTYMVAFFLIMMLPVMLFSVSYLIYSRSALENEISKNTAANVRFQLKALSDQLIRVEADLMQLAASPEMMSRRFLVRHEDYSGSDYWMAIREIIAEMRRITSSNAVIDEIILCFPSLELSVSSRTGVHTDFLPVFRAELSLLESEQPLFCSGDSLCLARYYPIYIQEGELPLIYAKVILSDESIRSAFSTVQAETAFYSLSTGKIIHSGGSVRTDEEILAAVSQTDFSSNWWWTNIHYTHDTGLCAVYEKSLDTVVCAFLPLEEIYKVPRYLQKTLTIYAIVCFPLLFLWMYLGMRQMRRPLSVMLRACDAVAAKRHDVRIPEDAKSREFHELIMHFNAMIEREEELVNTVFRQELLAREIELKQLQAQISPHFLYNSFFLLRHMVSNGENEFAERLADYLGSYFRYITGYTLQDTTLREEFAHARLYINIQQMRFPDRFVSDIGELPEAVCGLAVPRLILQPIFENTFVHGIRNMISGAVVRFSYDIDGETIRLYIEDNGAELTDETIENVQKSFSDRKTDGAVSGLVNINSRLRIRFGESYGLKAERSALGGMKITMTLPKNGGNQA